MENNLKTERCDLLSQKVYRILNTEIIKVLLKPELSYQKEKLESGKIEPETYLTFVSKYFWTEG